MRQILRAATLTTLSAAAIAAFPAAAPAAKQCLYQGDKATGANQAKVERSLLCLTNVHRLKNGVDPVPSDSRLSAAARAHSVDMATRHFFAHTNPDGIDAQGRATAAGYPSGASENIATNSTGTALSLFTQWRESTIGHNENMLNPSWKAAGMGIDPRFYQSDSPGITGTQMFGFAAADGKDTGLDLYASSNKCARAKLSLIFIKRKLKSGGGNRQRLRRGAKQFRKEIRKICKDPPQPKD